MYKRTSGNVLFLILIAVALFAALSYVVAQSSRSGGGSISNEKAQLHATQILSSAVAIKTAALRMVVGGYAIEDIMAYMAFYPDSPHLGGNSWGDLHNIAPDEVKKMIFHPNGGGLSFQEMPDEVFQNSPILSSYPQLNTHAWISPGGSVDVKIPRVGSDEPEDYIMLFDVRPEVCLQINKKLGVNYSVNGSAPCNVPNAAPDIRIGGSDPYYFSSISTGCANIFDGHPVFCGRDYQGLGDVYSVVYTIIEK